MRILFCNYEYPPLGGGGGVVNAWLAEELSKRHDVTVLTSHAGDLPTDSIENNVRVVRAPVKFRNQKAVASFASMFSFLPAAYRVGRKLIKENQFDVMNTHFVVPTGPIGQALASYGNIPNVLSLHGGDVYDPSKLTSPHRHLPLRMSIRWMLNKADVVVGQSKNTINNMRVFYSHDVYSVRIPLGIPRIKNTGIANRADYGISEDETVFATVGRLVSRKNIPELINVMQALKNEKARLLIMGTGPLEQQLRELAATFCVSDKVKFLGFIEEDEKFRILRMADAFVSTSLHEGFGLVFLEAMACGLPVISYNYGGQTDFLEDEQTGYLVPLGSTQRYIDRCREAIRNPNKRRAMGNENVARVEKYYIEHCARLYEDVYEEAIQKAAQQQKPFYTGLQSQRVQSAIGD